MENYPIDLFPTTNLIATPRQPPTIPIVFQTRPPSIPLVRHVNWQCQKLLFRGWRGRGGCWRVLLVRLLVLLALVMLGSAIILLRGSGRRTSGIQIKRRLLRNGTAPWSERMRWSGNIIQFHIHDLVVVVWSRRIVHCASRQCH